MVVLSSEIGLTVLNCDLQISVKRPHPGGMALNDTIPDDELPEERLPLVSALCEWTQDKWFKKQSMNDLCSFLLFHCVPIQQAPPDGRVHAARSAMRGPVWTAKCAKVRVCIISSTAMDFPPDRWAPTAQFQYDIHTSLTHPPKITIICLHPFYIQLKLKAEGYAFPLGERNSDRNQSAVVTNTPSTGARYVVASIQAIYQYRTRCGLRHQTQ